MNSGPAPPASNPRSSQSIASSGAPESKTALERAIELDPDRAGSHASLAFVLHNWEFDFEAAEAEYRRSLALGGNSHWHAYALFLLAARRYDEAPDLLLYDCSPELRLLQRHPGYRTILRRAGLPIR